MPCMACSAEQFGSVKSKHEAEKDKLDKGILYGFATNPIHVDQAFYHKYEDFGKHDDANYWNESCKGKLSIITMDRNGISMWASGHLDVDIWAS